MNKKTLAVFLAGVMAIGTLAGCGSKESGDSNAADSSAAEESVQEEDSDADSSEEADAADASDEPAAAGDSIVSAPTELTYIFADGDEGAKESMNEILKL